MNDQRKISLNKTRKYKKMDFKKSDVKVEKYNGE